MGDQVARNPPKTRAARVPLGVWIVGQEMDTDVLAQALFEQVAEQLHELGYAHALDRSHDSVVEDSRIHAGGSLRAVSYADAA